MIKMKRNPIEQSLKDPEKRAKLYLAINAVMMITTFLIVIGTILFILLLTGVIGWVIY